METMVRAAIGSGRCRRYGVVLGIAAGLIAAHEGLSLGADPIRHPDESAFLILAGADTNPPSFRKRPVADGVVARYLLDPRGEIEGLMLEDGTQMHITSRAADKLLQAIKPGQHVRVHGHRQDNAPLIQADVILNASTGTIFTVPFRLDFPIPEQEQHLSMIEMTAEGTIEALLFHALKGVVHGMLLSDGTQIRLPPDINEELRRSFHVGDQVSAEGNGTANEHGRCLEALSISLNGGKMTALDRSVTKLQ